MQEVICLYKYPCKGRMKSYVKSDARFFTEHGKSGAGVEFTLLLLGIASPGLLYGRNLQCPETLCLWKLHDFFFFFLKSSIFMSNTQENVTARNWGGDFVFSSVFLFSLSIALCSLSLETITLLPPALSACSVVVYRRDYLESCRTTLLKCSNEDKEWYLKTVNWLSRICQGKAKSVGKKANMCSLFVP